MRVACPQSDCDYESATHADFQRQLRIENRKALQVDSREWRLQEQKLRGALSALATCLVAAERRRLSSHGKLTQGVMVRQ